MAVRGRPKTLPPRLVAALGEDTTRNLAEAVDLETAQNLEAAVADLAKTGQLRQMSFLVQLFVASFRRTEMETAARFEAFNAKLDAILGWIGPAGDLPPQLGVRLERHHKELTHKLNNLCDLVERLAQAVEDKALASDAYSGQAIRELAGLKREVRDGLSEIRDGLDALAAPPEPAARAIGDGPRIRSAA